MAAMSVILKVTALLILLALFSSCGYTLRGNTREFFNQQGIRTLYVAPVKNRSYKAGVEITIYNALRKRIAQGGYVRIVDQPGLADAEIEASVLEASYAPSGITTVDQIAPVQTGPSNIQIASAYAVNLKVEFGLKKAGGKGRIWSDTVTRQKTFTASTYLGALGTTSALINEGDFERSVGELAVNLVTDAEESMNSVF
jgi:hypothetical protein